MITEYKASMAIRSAYTKIMWLQGWFIFKGCCLNIFLNYDFHNSLK